MNSTSFPYRIFALSMALLLFVSSVGLTLDLHYCQGKLKTYNFFGKAKSCHEIGQGMKDCPHHKKRAKADNSSKETINKKGCCSNKTVYLQSDQNQQTHSASPIATSIQLQHFVTAFVTVFLNTSIDTEDHSSFADYRQPIIPRDIYVLLETYLL